VLSPDGSYNLTELERYLDGHLPAKNLICAVNIDGTFDRMTTRSVSAQSLPYPTLQEALGNQTISELGPMASNLVGFVSPDYFGDWRLPDTISTFWNGTGLGEAMSSTCKLLLQPFTRHSFFAQHPFILDNLLRLPSSRIRPDDNPISLLS
jgi:hypothetical protein